MRNDEILEMVNEMIDCDGPVIIGNLTFYRSDIVRRLDPVAYREMVCNITDSMIEDLEYDLERLDSEVDADEIADIRERIESLENV